LSSLVLRAFTEAYRCLKFISSLDFFGPFLSRKKDEKNIKSVADYKNTSKQEINILIHTPQLLNLIRFRYCIIPYKKPGQARFRNESRFHNFIS